jgi:hypothetical protein
MCVAARRAWGPRLRTTNRRQKSKEKQKKKQKEQGAILQRTAAAKMSRHGEEDEARKEKQDSEYVGMPHAPTPRAVAALFPPARRG